MDELIKRAQAFVDAITSGRAYSHVDEAYAKNAESVEAVVPPGRELRITKGAEAIKAKRMDWAMTHDIHRLEADGPFIHPPNRFGVRFEAEVTQKASGRKMLLRELAIYTIEDGKIKREEFFMLPRK